MREIRLMEIQIGWLKEWMPIGYVNGVEVYRGERRTTTVEAFEYAMEWLKGTK